MIFYLKVLLFVFGQVLHISHLDRFLLRGDYLDQFDGLKGVDLETSYILIV
jgi:hypothetical protein